MNNTIFKICTIEREKEIFAMIKENLEFIKNNKIRFTWPKGSVEEEYAEGEYESYKNWLENKWSQEDNGFVKKLLSFFYRPEDIKFLVEISNYGPLGFYHSGLNRVTINKNTDLNPVDTIKHEMIHILIDPFIIRYKISQEEKERIADNIFKLINV